MKVVWTTFFFLCAVLAAPCMAEEQLSVRIAEAAPSHSQTDEALKDVIAVLKRVLGDTNYKLVAQCAVSLPANETRTLGQYTIACSGPKNNLTISVSRDRKEIVKTTVSFQKNSPFIVADNLPGMKKGQALVFVVR